MKNIFLTLSLIFTSFVFSQDIVFNAGSNNTTVNTCNGFVIDSGGQGGTGYSDNENVTITICPDTIGSGNNDDFINVVFNLFNLDVSDTDPDPNASNQDYMNVYDGPSTASNFLGVYTGNGLSSTTIQATNLNPSGCITLQFVSNNLNSTVANWGFTASATCATPCDPSISGAQIVGGATVDSIRVCVGDMVEFLEIGSAAQAPFTIASYEWNFMDGTTAVGAQNGTVQHAFTQPGHYVVNLFTTDDNAFTTCLNSNLNELNVFVATPPTFYNFPNDTTLCIGEMLDLTAQPEIFDSLWSGFPGSTQIDDGCMSDTLLGVAQVVPITMTGFDEPFITDAGQIESICFDMEHSYMGDLVIQVECPGGLQIVTLHQQGGGGTQIGVPVQTDDVDCINGLNQGTPFTYCFTPQATSTWVEWVANNGFGQTIPAGDYEPISPLSGLVGCPISGTWNLIVTDNWGADDGTVFGWSINLVDSLYPDIVQFTPNIGTNSDSSSWAISDPYVTNVSADGNVATIVPTVAGSYNYTYSVTDDFGCFNDSTLTITVDEQLIISAGLDTAICNGQPVVIGPQVPQCGADGGNYTYCYGNNENTTFTYCPDTPGDGLTYMSIAFNSGSTESFWDQITVYDGQNASAALIGVYEGDLSGLTFTATNPSGCITMVLTSDGSASCTSGSQTSWDYDVTCGGGASTAFVWTPDNNSLDDVNISNPTIVNLLSTTTYTLSVYPVGHPDCMTSDNVIVSIGGDVNAGLDSTIIICKEAIEQDLFQYLGGTPQLNGIWFNAAGDTILMPILPDTLMNGLYEYRKDSAGCSVSAFVDVTITEISLSAIIDHSDCQALNGEVTLTGINTLGPITYSNDFGATYFTNNIFTQGTLTTSGLGGALISLGADGSGIGQSYNFGVMDSVGCVASIDSIVIDDNFPVINGTNLIDSDCDVDNGQVNTVDVTGGTPNYTFSTDGVTYAPLALTNLAPFNYDLIAKDNFGCTDTVQITINEINMPIITSATGLDVNCFDAGNGSIDIVGTNLMSYSIDGGATFEPTGQFLNLLPGSYDIVGASGPNGSFCQTFANIIIISQPDSIYIDTLSSNLTVCVGDEITLGVLGLGGVPNTNYTYDWDYLGNNLGQGTTITTTVTDTMQICVTMNEDCLSPSNTKCMNIAISQQIFPKLTSDSDNGCFPLTVNLTNVSNSSNITTSIWEFSDDNVSNSVLGNAGITHTFQDPGVYNVYLEVTSSEGCIYDTTYSQFYTVHDHPDANYSYTTIPLTVYDSEASFVDYSTGDPTIWAWDFGSGAIPLTSSVQNPVVNYPKGIAGIYPTSLTVWNQYGCSDILEGQVEVINDVTIFAPNIFTPDGDEFNETWRVYISGIDVYDFHVTMFNRWGEVVWESFDPSGEWDGSYASDGTVHDGSFVWILHAKDSYNDKKYEFNGTVSIAR